MRKVVRVFHTPTDYNLSGVSFLKLRALLTEVGVYKLTGIIGAAAESPQENKIFAI